MSSLRATIASGVSEGLLGLWKRPLRSLLTAVTAAVAIAVTVNVISLSYGLDEDVRGDIAQFGRRTIDVVRLPVVLPGMRRAPLGPAEETKVRTALEGLDVEIVPRRQVVAGVTGGERVDRVPLVAAPAAFERTLDVGLVAGRWWTPDDGRDVCIVDRALLKSLFPAEFGVEEPASPSAALGRRVEVALPKDEMRTFEVIGVLGDPLRYREIFDEFDQGRTSRALTSSLLSFRNVYVPWETPVAASGEFTAISIVAPDEASVPGVAERLHEIWPAADADAPIEMLRTGIGVFVRLDWMEGLGSASQQSALFGNIVWIIIVLVASVMIGTLNLISIRERYDELAIRRCVGARRADVALQITTESVVTAFVGGLLGLPLGYAGAAVLRDIVNFPFRFEARYALPATGIAILLGLLASVVPARHAAKLQPAQVLTRRVR